MSKPEYFRAQDYSNMAMTALKAGKEPLSSSYIEWVKKIQGTPKTPSDIQDENDKAFYNFCFLLNHNYIFYLMTTGQFKILQDYLTQFEPKLTQDSKQDRLDDYVKLWTQYGLQLSALFFSEVKVQDKDLGLEELLSEEMFEARRLQMASWAILEKQLAEVRAKKSYDITIAWSDVFTDSTFSSLLTESIISEAARLYFQARNERFVRYRVIQSQLMDSPSSMLDCNAALNEVELLVVTDRAEFIKLTQMLPDTKRKHYQVRYDDRYNLCRERKNAIIAKYKPYEDALEKRIQIAKKNVKESNISMIKALDSTLKRIENNNSDALTSENKKHIKQLIQKLPAFIEQIQQAKNQTDTQKLLNRLSEEIQITTNSLSKNKSIHQDDLKILRTITNETGSKSIIIPKEEILKKIDITDLCNGLSHQTTDTIKRDLIKTKKSLTSHFKDELRRTKPTDTASTDELQSKIEEIANIFQKALVDEEEVLEASKEDVSEFKSYLEAVRQDTNLETLENLSAKAVIINLDQDIPSSYLNQIVKKIEDMKTTQMPNLTNT